MNLYINVVEIFFFNFMLVFNISLCVYVIIYLLYEINPFQDLIFLSLNNIEQSTALFTVQNTSMQ